MFLQDATRNKVMRILIVEDHMRIRELVLQALDNLGYEVEAAATADEALQLLENLSYDLVITDVRLPGQLDGVELAYRAKQFLNCPKTLVVGAYLERYSRERFDAVADALLRKPFTLKEIQGQVAKLIGPPPSRDTVV
jgi:CheY-like chemotaxis protein